MNFFLRDNKKTKCSFTKKRNVDIPILGVNCQWHRGVKKSKPYSKIRQHAHQNKKGGKIYWHCPIFICRWIFDIVNFTKTLIPGCGGPDPGHHDGGPGLRLRPQLHQGHDCGGARFQPHRPETGNWFGGWVWPAVEPGRRWDWVPGRHVQLSEPEAGARAEEFQPRHSQRQVCGTRQGDHAGNHNNYINI